MSLILLLLISKVLFFLAVVPKYLFRSNDSSVKF